MGNIITYGINDTTVTARSAEVTAADWSGGLNLGGSNAPGVGINTGAPDPKPQDWSLLDQEENERTPQGTQHIGGNALGDGDDSTMDVKAYISESDDNDTLSFVTAAQETVDGAGLGPGGADPINRTGITVDAGQNCWGTNTVA